MLPFKRTSTDLQLFRQQRSLCQDGCRVTCGTKVRTESRSHVQVIIFAELKGEFPYILRVFARDSRTVYHLFPPPPPSVRLFIICVSHSRDIEFESRAGGSINATRDFRDLKPVYFQSVQGLDNVSSVPVRVKHCSEDS
jgi:hypothetical protein